VGFTSWRGPGFGEDLTGPESAVQWINTGTLTLGLLTGLMRPVGEVPPVITASDVAPAVTAAEGGVYQRPGYIPDDSIIVKGGTKAPPMPGEEFSTSHGATLEEAGAGVPHGQVQPTTAGAIRANGGTVTPAPEMTGNVMNYQHANVVEGSAPTVFDSTIPNPVPKRNRIGGPNYGK
jgi:hypothetical protein